jgi:hypothetical protein
MVLQHIGRRNLARHQAAEDALAGRKFIDEQGPVKRLQEGGVRWWRLSANARLAGHRSGKIAAKTAVPAVFCAFAVSGTM